MNFQEFLETIMDKIKEYMAEDQYAEIQQIRKNNDVVLHGLTIHSKQCNISPTIYMESFYKLYQRGAAIDQVMEKIYSLYQESLPKTSINMDFFKDFDKVKDRIVYKLIHADRNQELLQDIPHIPFWDLAICFSYAFWTEELGDGMILIHNSHIDAWKVNHSQLMRLAEENTPRLLPMTFYGMNEVLKQMHVDMDLSQMEEEQLYVLTNQQKIYGAAVILYPKTLLWVGEQLQSDFYIIPSSIHEVLILRADEQENVYKEGQTLHDMISDINDSQLNSEEVLSDFPYFYSWKDNKLTQIL